MKTLDEETNNGTINLFDNKVVIIDEAHNFVSRIVNKLKQPTSLAMRLYEYLLRAQNCRVVLLTGTPIINYPNEIGITMNILRGTIKVWHMQLLTGESKITQEFLVNLFKSYSLSNNVFDFIQYNKKQHILTITRNPYGFYSYNDSGKPYKGISFGEDGNIDDTTFIEIITKVLLENNIKIISGSVRVDTHPCMPDTLENFSAYFIEDNKVKNMNLFKRRILGLTSYFPDITLILII